MPQADVSVIWDGQGATCLRVKIRHFTLFGWGKRTHNNSYLSVRYSWSSNVLVCNATKSTMLLLLLPVAAITRMEKFGAGQLSAVDATARVEGQKNTDRTLPPWSSLLSAVTLAPEGRHSFSSPGGIIEGHLIVCTLPDRHSKVPSGSPLSPVEQPPSSSTRNVSPTGQQQQGPSSTSSHNESKASGQSVQQQSSDDTERLLYWDTLGVRTGDRVTMLENRIDLGPSSETRVDKRAANLKSEALRLAEVSLG